MARIFTDGAEFGDLLFWTATGAFTTASTAEKRSGAYSYKVADTPMQKNISGISEGYLRFGLRLTDVVNVNNFCYLRKGTTILAALRLNASKTVEAYAGNVATLLHTSIGLLAINTWYLIEWHYKLDNSVGVSELKIDGVPDGTFSGDTQPGADTTFDRVDLLNSASQFDYFDDIALNDVNGGVDDSWCGDGHIELLIPSGNSVEGGWSDDFVGSDADSTNNYALVDEIPSNSDTDYVQSATPGDQDQYALTDWTGTGKVVLRVWVEARAEDTVPEGAQIKLGLKINSSPFLSDPLTLAATYGRIAGPEYIVNPDDSNPFEDADIDAMEIMMEVV